MFNHEAFEDYLDYVPVKQLALADIYRDATRSSTRWAGTPTSACRAGASRCR